MKKILTLSLVALVVAAALATPVSAAESTVTVEFTEGDGYVEPVDPDDPSLPLQPPDGGGTGETGSLTLNYVSPILFGPQKISRIKEVYPSLTLRPFVQVTDLRGLGDGWELRAVASPFESVTGDVLTGAELTLNNGYAISVNMSAPAPTPVPSVKLPADGETEELVFYAAGNTGFGTWLDRWYPSESTMTTNDNVTLTVPGSITKATAYTSTITWTLIDAE